MASRKPRRTLDHWEADMRSRRKAQQPESPGERRRAAEEGASKAKAKQPGKPTKAASASATEPPKPKKRRTKRTKPSADPAPTPEPAGATD
jgi:hypothetical protein